MSKQVLSIQNSLEFAVSEISISYSSPKNTKWDKVVIKTSSDAERSASWRRKFWSSNLDIIEEFYVLYLNRAQKVKGIHYLSKGGITNTVVDLRVIFGIALKCLASKIILAHNHRSGICNPSQADKNITLRMAQAGILLNIELIDHLIILPDYGFFSFADNGLIDEPNKSINNVSW